MGGFFMKKVFGVLTAIPLLSLSLISQPVSAIGVEEDTPSYYTLTEYNSLIQEGTLDPSITYEQWSTEGSSQESSDKMESSPNYVIQDPGSSSFTLQKGDIVVTNGTTMKGLTGHAGIAISSTEILSISGAGHTPSVMSFSAWKVKYNPDTFTKNHWTKVYRVGSSSYANEAANWAINHYKGKNYSYQVNRYLFDVNPTYCSKIVWQSYALISKPLIVQPTSSSNIIYPYELDNSFIDSANLKRVAYID